MYTLWVVQYMLNDADLLQHALCTQTVTPFVYVPYVYWKTNNGLLKR